MTYIWVSFSVVFKNGEVQMDKIMFLLIVMAATLSAQADVWSSYPNQVYQPYQLQNTFQSVQSPDYSITQPSSASYNQGYYQNPYQTQCLGQYINPYQRPYGSYSPYNVAGSVLSGSGSMGGTQQIVRNIGQSLLYSVLRGY